MIENDANRTLILDKNYNVILVTLRYIIWMYLGFFFSLLMADHTKIALTLMSFLSLSMDLSMILDAGACPRKLPFIRLGRDQENSVNTKLGSIERIHCICVTAQKRQNKFQFMWCFASASAAIETMKNGELTCRLNSSKSKNKLAAVEIISSF